MSHAIVAWPGFFNTLLDPTGYQKVLNKGLGKISDFGIKAGIVTAIFQFSTIKSSFGPFWAHEGWDKQTVNFVSSTSTYVQGLADTTSGMMKRLGVKATKIAAEAGQAVKWTGRLVSYLEFAGKAFGVIGGVAAAMMLFWKSYEDFEEGNFVLSILHAALGVLTVAATMMLLIPGPWSIVGAAILLLVAIVEAVIGWLSDTDLQSWLNKSFYFGRHKEMHWLAGPADYTVYSSPMAQHKAYLQLFSGAS